MEGVAVGRSGSGGSGSGDIATNFAAADSRFYICQCSMYCVHVRRENLY